MRRGSSATMPTIGSATFLVIAALLSGCATGVRIHDRPISFSEWRLEATRAYIAEHYEREVDEITIEPRIVVLHWTAIDDLEETHLRFDPEALPAVRADLGGTDQVNVSSQFLVDRDGTVYR